jgi:hypothetical protein
MANIYLVPASYTVATHQFRHLSTIENLYNYMNYYPMNQYFICSQASWP